ncbi:class I adenylate-forming enzyme family protein [Micromonospora mirobrigensis]|uniref:Long-chain acyl-CoA synthetase n=1 Tax=Micromonospora mirobrigensis TaxID=262898 RepID=A0A1C5AL11_9ACTN|nr:class I adenylate-forming enzyme family protein [Micromonospora mirobrigensis]SCF45897.1 long-chain acyl-CoA synthetase [Micromonospora mirobrigensis]
MTVSSQRSMLLSHRVSAWAVTEPARPAIRDRHLAMTYRELDAAVEDTARQLRNHGVRNGRGVAVMTDPTVAAVVMMLAVMRVGGHWIGLNPRYSRREQELIVRRSAPAVLVSVGRVGADFGDLALETSVPWLAVDPTTGKISAQGTARAGREPIEVPAGTASVVFTSGSTGAPKGVIISAAALAANCRIAATRWRECLDVVLCDLPVNHVGFIGDIVGTALWAGARIILEPRFDPARTVELARSHRLTAWTGVPAMFAAVAAETGATPAAFRAVRRVLWGGAAMPPQVIDAVRALTDAPLTTVYGSTETVGNIASADSGDVAHPRDLAAMLGSAFGPFAMRVVGDSGDALVGQAGRIEVRTPFGYTGYLGDAPRSERDDPQGSWLTTGDLGVIDGRGLARYQGRADHLFKTGGYFVNPQEIEQELQRIPGVAEAVVVPMADDARGHVPAAVISGPADMDTDQLRHALRAVLAPYKVPRHMTVVASLPRLPVGKVDRGAARRLLEQEAG